MALALTFAGGTTNKGTHGYQLNWQIDFTTPMEALLTGTLK
jgi:hypothetical protein